MLSKMLRPCVPSLSYHAYTLWLFVFSDLKTMVLPSAAFAIFNSMAISLGQPNIPERIWTRTISRVPMMLVWAWVNTLAFTVNNQRQPNAAREDELNKPWRPIPSQRLSPVHAKYLAIFAYAISLLVSILAGGGASECILLMFFGFLYNDLKLGDVHWLSRNILNACGFTSFAAGALEIALQAPLADREMICWLLMIGGAVCCTVFSQDMYDQVGDAAAGRRTIPLIIGDAPARWYLAFTVVAWSIACSWYWQAGLCTYLIPVLLGCSVAVRTCFKRTVEADRSTFRVYNLWLVSLYSIPLLRLGYRGVVAAQPDEDVSIQTDSIPMTHE